MKGTWIDSEDPTIYAIFFIPRSHSEVHQFHEDWRYTAKTQIMTMLVPINKFDIHLKYYDADDEERGYEYKYGKGIASLEDSSTLPTLEMERRRTYCFVSTWAAKMRKYGASHKITSEMRLSGTTAQSRASFGMRITLTREFVSMEPRRSIRGRRAKSNTYIT